VLLFVITTDTNRNSTFVGINKNKNFRIIKVDFVVDTKRPNDVPNSSIDLRAVDFVIEAAVENDTIPIDV
jgi:hypothetical protein